MMMGCMMIWQSWCSSVVLWTSITTSGKKTSIARGLSTIKDSVRSCFAQSSAMVFFNEIGIFRYIYMF